MSAASSEMEATHALAVATVGAARQDEAPGDVATLVEPKVERVATAVEAVATMVETVDVAASARVGTRVDA